MAATTGILLPVGTRHVRSYNLDSTLGLPLATSVAAYEGLEFTGARAFALTMPDPRTIEHPGNDRLVNRDQLPPLTGATATISSSKVDYPLHAQLTGTLVSTVGEAKGIGVLTDKQGFEPQQGLMMFQQAEDASDTSVDGLRRWRSIFAPKAFCIPKKPGMGDNPEDTVYNVVPQIVTQDLWGILFTLNTNGYLKAQFREFMTQYQPMVVAWLGDNSATKFTFAAAHQCADIAKAEVSVNGVHDATAVVATDGVTPTAKPGATDRITCFYEWA